MKYVQSPWLISLLLAVITIIWVKWELASLRQLPQQQVEPPAEQPAATDEQPTAAKEPSTPQEKPEPNAQPVPPNLQAREPIRWEDGLPPPMPFTGGFTQVSEVDQPLDIEDGAFQQTE